MAYKSSDIQVLVGADGSGKIDGASGKLIQKELRQITDAISKTNPPKITINIDSEKTQKAFQKQLNNILKAIKLDPVKLNFGNNTVGNKFGKTIPFENFKGAVVSAKAMSQATAEFTKVKKEGIKALNDEEIASRQTINGLKVRVQLGKEEAAIIKSNNISEAKYKKQEADINKITTAQRLLNQEISAYKKFGYNNTALFKNAAFKADYETLGDRYKSLIGSTDVKAMKTLNSDFVVFKRNVAEAGLLGQTFTGKLGSQMEKLGVYFSAATIMMEAWQQLKNMIDTVIELDKHLVNLQMITGGTRLETEKLVSTYNDLAKKLGVTTADVAISADEWLRQGKSASDTNKLIKDTMILSKIGMLSSADGTKYLTSVMKGYKVEAKDALEIVDKVSKIDMVSAAGAGGLMEGMSRASNFANDVGYSMDKLLATLAAIGEATQRDMSTVSDSMKNLFSRMSNIKLGKLTDSETGESLSDVEASLKTVNIKLRENEKTFRNYGDVIDEVASKWNGFNDIQQNTVASAFAGTSHIEDFHILMSNYENIQKYTDEAASSAGSSMEKFDAYQQGAEASFQTLKANFEDLSATMINSEFVKGVVDTGSGLLGFLTQSVDLLGTLPALLTAAAGALSGFQNKGISNVKYAPPYPCGMAA